MRAKNIKAIALVSGGLDSVLAAKIVAEQGIEVIAVNFIVPFWLPEKQESMQKQVFNSCQQIGVRCETVDISSQCRQMIKDPQYGFGSHMNPCIDCRLLMLKKAGELLKGFEASFLITGEVVGQRPMSQKKETMRMIEKNSGLEGLILRPLSAKLLEETIPEQKGWVDRAQFFGISGRGRGVQMDLARQLQISDYPNPGGGCLLTDPAFSRRFQDLLTHGVWKQRDLDLLKMGRVFRINHGSKLIVGRNEGENAALEKAAGEDDIVFTPLPQVSGPSALGVGQFIHPGDVALCAMIVCRYVNKSTSPTGDICEILIKRYGKQECLHVPPLKEEDIRYYQV
ncbi:MAG: tRNA 4-thiouridine(8) synthase ThiI [Candidatus Omnitrophota bacterium]